MRDIRCMKRSVTSIIRIWRRIITGKAAVLPGRFREKILRAEILQAEILQAERFRAGRGRIRHQAQDPFMEAGRRERRSRQDGRHRWAK